MTQDRPKRPLTDDQKRARLILLIIAGVIAIVSIGVGALAMSIGLSFWIAAIIAIVVAAVVGLFMFLNLA